MAATGYTPIQLYYSTTASAVPSAGNLASGELAINITDGKLYYKSNAGTVTLLAGATSGPAGGSNTQVQFNSSGVLAGSSNLTFNGTTLTAGGLTSSGVLDVNGTTESSSIITGAAVIDGGVGIAKSLYVGGNATVTKDTGTSTLRLQSLAPYGFPGDFSITAGGQSTPALTITDNTAAQERLNIFTGVTVFNEAGVDQDFRIESDTQPNMFFLDAGNDRIGFKTNTPVGYLTVGGAYDQFLTFVDQRTNPSGTYDSYMAWQTYATTPLLLGFTHNDYANTNRRFFIKFSFDNTPTYQERMGINYLETVFNESSADVDFRVESDASTHMLFVDAANNAIGVATSSAPAWASGYNPVHIGANLKLGSTGAGATFSQIVHAANYDGTGWNQAYTDVAVARIEFSGNTSGSLQNFYTANNVTAGSPVTSLLNLTLSPSAAVFNEGGLDIDFRVESDTNANMLFVDAGNSRVGINNGSPTVALDVTGSFIASGSIQSSDNLFVGGSATTSVVTLDRAVFLNSTSNNATIGYNMYINDGANNRRGTMFLNDTTGVWGFDVTASSGVPTYVFYRAGSDFFHVGDDIVVNDIGADVDFRVESDTSTHGLFMDAGQASVSVNTSSTAAFFNVQGSATRIVSQELGNGADQGTAQFNRIVKLCPSVSSNNKLIIPFTSQGSLNSNTVCRVMGHNAAYNTSTPQGFEISFAVGHLNAMYSLSYWGAFGNAISAALNGQTVEITFSSSYNVAYGISGGVFVTLEYMTNVLSYSIDVANVRLN